MRKDRDLISYEFEMLLQDYRRMLEIVGASADVLARLDRVSLSGDVLVAVMGLADCLNRLPESLLNEAVSSYLATVQRLHPETFANKNPPSAFDR